MGRICSVDTGIVFNATYHVSGLRAIIKQLVSGVIVAAIPVLFYYYF